MHSLVVHYAKLILTTTVPPRFMMETYDKNLQPKALAKYQPLLHVFQALGYSVAHSFTSEQKDRWMMVLQSP